MGACSPIEIAYEAPDPDEKAFSLIDIDQSIRHVTGGKYTTLPAGDYELVFGSGSHTQVMPFTVVGDADAALTPNDSSQIVERGVFFWANGSPFINLSWGGEVYPVSFSVETDTVDFSGLTTGDTVEIVMRNYVEEVFPAHGYLYSIRKLSDGTPSDLPAALVDTMADMGYTITETE